MKEILICKTCNELYDNYNELKFYSYDSGGFCQRCDGDDFIETTEDKLIEEELFI